MRLKGPQSQLLQYFEGLPHCKFLINSMQKVKKKQSSCNYFCKNKLNIGLVACFHLVYSKKYGTFCASPATFYRDIL